MATPEEHVQKALDTLMVLCDLQPVDPENRDRDYNRRAAAEEILRHYREERVFSSILTNGITVNINGAVPVRPMTRSEMGREPETDPTSPPEADRAGRI